MCTHPNTRALSALRVSRALRYANLADLNTALVHAHLLERNGAEKQPIRQKNLQVACEEKNIKIKTVT